MPWVYLLLAGLLEIGWAVGLKHVDGWTRFWPSVITIALMVTSLGFLSLAMRSLPMGTAYAMWTGIGAVGTVLVGIFCFGEPRTATQMASVAFIVVGLIGLKLAAS
jgi:quaternary ammonium compound-resistance protein SugE